MKRLHIKNDKDAGNSEGIFLAFESSCHTLPFIGIGNLVKCLSNKDTTSELAGLISTLSL